jgi:threonine/homoserine/homoserine lactone efflux protein
VSAEFVITSIVVALIPGTGVVYTLSSAIAGGVRRGLYAAAGGTLGILPHIAAALLGLSGILQTGATLFELIRWAGVGYLLYLGLSLFRDAGPMRLDCAAGAATSPVAIMRRGVLLNLLNPKLTLFFFAFLPQFLEPGAGLVDVRLVALGAVFMVLTFVVFAGYAYLGAALRDRVLGAPVVRRFVERTIGAVLIAFAARLAVGDR